MVDFSPFLQGRQCPVFFPVHQDPSEKGSSLKGKNLLPMGANSFLLEWSHFGRELNNFERVDSLKI